MPDYPYVYTDLAIRGVEPGGTRVRVFRRRRQGEGASAGPPSGEGEWRALLESAVAELNEAFERSGAPWQGRLEEDDAGFLLRVTRTGGAADGPAAEEVEEVLEPADLPAWLGRLRSRLGLLVDERV